MKRIAWILLVLIIGLTAMISYQSTGNAGEPAKYAGVDNCKMCHPDIHGDWSKMPHARAFGLLVNVGEEKNPKCLPCHSTGYNNGGFVDETKTPDLEGVTCEACHGPGADHMGDKTKIQRVPDVVKTCAACHQKQNIHAVENGG